MSCRSDLALKERAKWAFSLKLVQYLYQISCHSTDFFALYLLLKILFVYQHSSPEAATQRCSIKKVFLEISQNSKENTCAKVSFLIKLQTAPATLLKRRLWHRCFAVNFAKFLRAPFVTEHLWWLLLLIPFNLLLVDSVSMLILKKIGWATSMQILNYFFVLKILLICLNKCTLCQSILKSEHLWQKTLSWWPFLAQKATRLCYH